MGNNTFKFAVAKPPKSADHNAPRSGRLTHNADKKLPQFLQRRPSHCNHSSLTAERHVDVDACRLKQLPARVDTRRKEPPLIGTQAVRAEQDTRVIHGIQQRRTHAARRRKHERQTIRHRTATAIATARRPDLLGRRRRPKACQRPARQRQRQRSTAARVDGKAQVFEELRPAAERNEVRDCLLWNDLFFKQRHQPFNVSFCHVILPQRFAPLILLLHLSLSSQRTFWG